MTKQKAVRVTYEGIDNSRRLQHLTHEWCNAKESQQRVYVYYSLPIGGDIMYCSFFGKQYVRPLQLEKWNAASSLDNRRQEWIIRSWVEQNRGNPSRRQTHQPVHRMNIFNKQHTYLSNIQQNIKWYTAVIIHTTISNCRANPIIRCLQNAQ